MPKGPQGQKRPADAIGNAVHIARIATGEAEETSLKQPAKRKSGLAGALRKLSTSYTSHSFVIDHSEAGALFSKVRLATKDEMKTIDGLGRDCRYPGRETIIRAIETDLEGEKDVQPSPSEKKPRKRARAPSARNRANGTDSPAPE